MTTNVISLVSIGAHPTSGRPRRAEQDARAVELGLQMAGDKLQVLHAGNIAEPTLRSYLGMGLPQLHVLEQPEGSDASTCATPVPRWCLPAARPKPVKARACCRSCWPSNWAGR